MLVSPRVKLSTEGWGEEEDDEEGGGWIFHKKLLELLKRQPRIMLNMSEKLNAVKKW